MSHGVSPEEARAAQVPHELFLFNLIFNHVFLFIVTVSAPSLQFLVLIVPLLSLVIMGFTLWSERRANARGSRFVACHWTLALRRTAAFAAMWLGFGLWLFAIYLWAGGAPGPRHYALLAPAFLPLLGVLLTLVIMESEALQHARHRSLPAVAAARCRLKAALGLAA